jgi:hypothetical protein
MIDSEDIDSPHHIDLAFVANFPWQHQPLVYLLHAIRDA